MAPVTIHGRTWNISAGGDDVPNTDTPVNPLYPKRAVDAAHTDFIILQLKEPVPTTAHEWLTKHSVHIISRVDAATLLCEYEKEDLALLRTQDFVLDADVYHTFWKLPPAIDLSKFASEHPEADESEDAKVVEDEDDNGEDKVNVRKERKTHSGSLSKSVSLAPIPAPAPPAPIPIIIELHASHRTEKTDEVLDALLAKKLVDPAQTTRFSNRIETSAHIADIPAIAAIDHVRAIDEAHPDLPHVTVARDVLNCPWIGTGASSDGNQHAKALGGGGQVINIVDSGLDKGLLDDMHPAFTAARCKALYMLEPRGNLPGSRSAADPLGHGTHVAGCALANGESATMGGANANQAGVIRGPAYDAEFTVTQYMDVTGAIMARDLAEFLDRPYKEHGCRISNHSYGPRFDPYASRETSLSSMYDARSKDVDAYLSAHPDMVVTWSAGNDGEVAPNVPGQSQIVSRAMCKNVITVGSTMSARRVEGGSKFSAKAHTEADTYTMSSSSSSGPALTGASGRIKPDVCAPGRVILSAHSRDPAAVDKGTFGVSTDANYKWDTGTSMAAPAVAGCVAVLRQALGQQGISSPSGAVIKALLVNGAIDMMREPGQPPQIPNNSQGFGRVNLQGSLHMVWEGTASPPTKEILPHAGFLDITNANKIFQPVLSGTSQSFPPLTVPGASPLAGVTDGITNSGKQADAIALDSPLVSRSLKVTLTWYDLPEALLQDRLALVVTHKDTGERRHGNMGDKDMRATPAEFDTVNSVQLVLWENVPPGQVVFEVSCQALLPGRQVEYALAWSLE